MIEVKFGRGATDYTLTAVTIPDCDLDLSGNQAATLVYFRLDPSFLARIDCDQLELENQTFADAFLPSIDQMKNPVVGPNSRMDFLVDPHRMRLGVSSFERFRCFVKLAVFC